MQGGALIHIRDTVNASQAAEEVIVGAAKLGAVVGTFCGGALMSKYGRRPAMAVDSIFFIVGPLVMALSFSVSALVCGRCIVGIGIGISAVVVPSYLGEVAPSRIRGRVVELYEVMLCFGMLASSLADAAFEGLPGNWRWMVGAPVLPAALMIIAVAFIPESPRWLVMRGRLQEALAVMHRVYTSQLLPLGSEESTAEVEAELLELWSSVEKDREAARILHAGQKSASSVEPVATNDVELVGGASFSSTSEINHSNIDEESRRHLLAQNPSVSADQQADTQGCAVRDDDVESHTVQQPNFFKVLLSTITDTVVVARGSEYKAFYMAMILAFFNQAFASTSIISYAPSVLEHAGVDNGAISSLFTALIGGSKMLGVIISFLLVDTIGRRPLLMCGSAGCAVALSLLIPADWLDSHALLVVGMCLFILFFSLSWAGVFWVLLSELFSMATKSPATSAATAVLFLTGAIADLSFLTLHRAMGPLVFGLYALIAVCSGVYVCAFVPETKGRTLQDVQSMMQ